MIILAALVGALLVTRGLTILLPSLQGVAGTLVVVVLAGASIAFQGGYLGKRKSTKQAPAATDTPSTPPSTK